MSHLKRTTGLAVIAALSCALASHGQGCIPEDIDGDNVVGGADLAVVLGAWGEIGGPGDVIGDPVVDGADIGAVLGAWGAVAPSACAQLEGIDPPAAPPGEQIKLFGTFSELDPDQWCVVGMNEEGQVVPFEVVEISENSMVLRVGPIDPGTGPVQIMMGLGTGTVGGAASPPGTSVSPDSWSWEANGEGEMFPLEFTPVDAGAPPIQGTFYGTLANGDLCVTIDGDCPPGTKFRIWPRAHHYGSGTADDPYVGYDCYIPCVVIQDDLAADDCAVQLCQVIEAVYAAHQPNPIVIDCDVTQVAGGYKLTLSLPGLDIDWGVFTIEVLDPSVPCGTECSPNPDCPCDLDGNGVVDVNDFLLIEKNFGTQCEPGTPCCGDLNGDGIVDGFDIDEFFACKQAGCGPDCTETCACDVTGDGVVDDRDLVAIKAALGQACDPDLGPCCEDLNGDGIVDLFDLTFFLEACQQGPCP